MLTVFVDLFDLVDGMSLDAVENAVRAARERAAREGIERIYLDISMSEACLKGERPETAQEAALREHIAFRRASENTAQRRTLYEELRKEFEGR